MHTYDRRTICFLLSITLLSTYQSSGAMDDSLPLPEASSSPVTQSVSANRAPQLFCPNTLLLGGLIFMVLLPRATSWCMHEECPGSHAQLPPDAAGTLMERCTAQCGCDITEALLNCTVQCVESSVKLLAQCAMPGS